MYKLLTSYICSYRQNVAKPFEGKVSSPSKYASIGFLPWIFQNLCVPKQQAMPGSSHVLEVPTIQGPNPSRLFGHSNSWLLLKSLKRDSQATPGFQHGEDLKIWVQVGRGFGGRFKVLVLFMFGEKKWPLALMNYEIWYTFNFTSAPNNMKTVLHKTCITIHAKIRST